MQKEEMKRKKLPNGFCRQVAEIVGSDKWYVSKVLCSPESYTGPQAEAIKAAAIQLNEKINSLRAAFIGAAL